MRRSKALMAAMALSGAASFGFLADAKAAASSMAANWFRLSTGSNGTVTLIDTSSMVAQGRYRLVWLKQDYSAVKTERARYSIQRWKIDCESRTLEGQDGAFYLPNGNVMQSIIGTGRLQPVIPESIAEDIFETVCKDMLMSTEP